MIKISIITVSYNSFNTIKKTIESVINQTYKNIEYIIIDGNSNDGTQNIIEEYRKYITYYISESDNGIYDGMNKGINFATGDYTLFLNTDDTLYDSSTIAQVVEQMEQNKVFDVYYGNNNIINEYGTFISIPRELSLLKTKFPISHQAIFIRTNILKQNLFDINYKYCADFKQISSLYLNKKSFKYINITISTTPISSGATYDNYIASTREHFKVLKERDESVFFLEIKTILLKFIVRKIKTITPNFILHPILRVISRYKIL